jgi:ribosomal protein L30/L7E
LYKEKCLYFVKIGTPQKLSYDIDQAMNTLHLLKNSKAKVVIDTSSIRPKRICLWIILDRKKKINKLSELNSLIFKWKLAEWVRLSKSLKIEPTIAINYRK